MFIVVGSTSELERTARLPSDWMAVDSFPTDPMEMARTYSIPADTRHARHAGAMDFMGGARALRKSPP